MGTQEEQADDPLLAVIAGAHRGPLNRQQLKGRPNNAPKLREFPETVGVCDWCNGAACPVCRGKPVPQAPHLLRMHQMDEANWNSKMIREATLRQMWEREGHTGYPDEFYEAKNTFMESAAECFNRHRRPQGFCIDWESDDKRLTDVKWQERYHDSQKRLQEMGLEAPGSMERKHVYLCHFCPVASFVKFKQRESKGMYNQ